MKFIDKHAARQIEQDITNLIKPLVNNENLEITYSRARHYAWDGSRLDFTIVLKTTNTPDPMDNPLNKNLVKQITKLGFPPEILNRSLYYGAHFNTRFYVVGVRKSTRCPIVIRFIDHSWANIYHISVTDLKAAWEETLKGK
jgi:hypothetical protein